LTTHPHSAPRLKKEHSCTCTPPLGLYGLFQGEFTAHYHLVGHTVAQLVDALRYKLLRSRVRFPMVSLEFFIYINLSSRTMALGLTQPLTEMSTRHISWG
jgi:hypothetical protein